MRVLPALLLLFGLAASPAADPPNGVLANRAVRYVNDQALTLGDVQLRLWEWESQQRRSGRPPPTASERHDFILQALEELTDEELLVQYGREKADQFKFRVVDQEQIRRRVMDEARNQPLVVQADRAKVLERREIVDFALSFFERSMAHITDAEVAAAYQEHRAQFTIPARIQACAIVFRATSPAERKEVVERRKVIFREAQKQEDARLRQVAESQLDAFLAAKPEAQERILADVVRDLAAHATRQDLDRAGAALAAEAKTLCGQEASFRDLAGAKAQLEQLRQQLAGREAEAFRDAARRQSQGWNAVQGGNLAPEPNGWLEPGRYQAELDERAFACKTGEMSPVFTVDAEQMACLVLVTAREDARVQPLDEVRGRLRAELQSRRVREIRENALAMLRSRANLRDIMPLESLLQ